MDSLRGDYLRAPTLPIRREYLALKNKPGTSCVFFTLMYIILVGAH